MENPRSLVCTPNQVVGRAWVSPLGAVGSTVTLVDTPTGIRPDVELVLAHVLDENGAAVYQALGHLRPQTSAMVVLPRSDLVEMVEALSLPTVTAALVEGYVDSRLLTYVSAKALWGDIFGLSKVLPWGVQVHSEAIITQQERTVALQNVGRFARALGLRGKHVDAIELVLDELVMNALYNAPVGEDGQSLYGSLSTSERAAVTLERPVILQVACDGSHFAASVRDSYGSLQRSTIVEYMTRCARARGEQMEIKASGAGLGLYLVASNVTEFICNLLPGVATEIICVFDLKAPRQQLMHIGVYEEISRSAASSVGRPRKQMQGRPAPSGNILARASTPRMVAMTMVTAVLLLVVAMLFLVIPSLRRPGKGTLEVDVTPPGSAIYVDGVLRGEASPVLAIQDLDTGVPHAVVARHAGFQDAQEVVRLERRRHGIRLSLRQNKARIRVDSAPRGASIMLDGKPTGHNTPALLEGLESGHAYNLTLVLHGHKSVTENLIPSSEETLMFRTSLPVAGDFAQLVIDSKPSGAQLFINDVDTGQVTPVAGHTLRAGRYRIRLALEGRVPWEQQVDVKPGEVVKRSGDLPEGGLLTLRSSVPVRASIDNVFSQQTPIVKRVIPVGTHNMRLHSDAPLVDQVVEIKMTKAGGTATRNLVFGFVATKRAHLKIKIDKYTASKAAFLPGHYKIKLIDTKAGQTRTEEVEVVAKKTVSIE